MWHHHPHHHHCIVSFCPELSFTCRVDLLSANIPNISLLRGSWDKVSRVEDIKIIYQSQQLEGYKYTTCTMGHSFCGKTEVLQIFKRDLFNTLPPGKWPHGPIHSACGTEGAPAHWGDTPTTMTIMLKLAKNMLMFNARWGWKWCGTNWSLRDALVLTIWLHTIFICIALCVFPCQKTFLKFLNVYIYFMLISNRKESIPSGRWCNNTKKLTWYQEFHNFYSKYDTFWGGNLGLVWQGWKFLSHIVQIICIVHWCWWWYKLSCICICTLYLVPCTLHFAP